MSEALWLQLGGGGGSVWGPFPHVFTPPSPLENIKAKIENQGQF